MKSSPLVSIIMNCKNGDRYLEDSLKSIINQTYENWELIFVDNSSTDNSKKIFDLRNIYNRDELEKIGFEYYGTGR